MRLIDADAFDERVRVAVGMSEEELTDDFKDGIQCTLYILSKMPTIQPTVNQQLIHCKDCKHYEGNWYCSAWNNSPGFPMVTEDGFCDLAERIEDET